MSQQSNPEVRPELSRALDQMVDALEILDELEAPGDIGSHLDHAIARLEAMLGLAHQPTRAKALLARLSEASSASDADLGSSVSPWDVTPA